MAPASDNKLSKLFRTTIVFLVAFSGTESATVRDIFNLNADPLLRIPRDNKYFLDRYGSGSSRNDASTRTLKPEEAAEARDGGVAGTNLEKRCSGCDSSYPDYRDYRSPYDTGRFSSRYDTRGSRDRYDDRDYTDRYDNYYDRYDYRDRYYDRDRYDNRRPDNYYYDRYDRDRYDGRDRGYDNRNSYRPWDETYRGTSGWDSSTGRGYYFASGRPDYGSGYASSWNYGRGDDRDYRNRDQGYGAPTTRPRDYYDYGYRGTSYLYGRPSSSTTTSSSNPSDSDNSVTDSPRDSSPSDPIFFNIKSLPLKIIDKKSI